MSDELFHQPRPEAPPPAPPPGPILQSAAIGFRVVFLVTLALGAIWLCSNFRVISSDRQAVVMRFGAVVRAQKSGLLLAWPKPIEEVRMLPGPDRQLARQVGALAPVPGITAASADPNEEAGAANSSPYLTGDGNVVMLDATLNYRISDPINYVLSLDHVDTAMDRMFRAAAVQVAASQTLNDFLVAEPTSIGNADATINARRQALRDRMLENVNTRLAALDALGMGMGIEVQRIDMNPRLPPQAKLAYDTVLTAGQRAEQNIAAATTAATLRRQGADREADRVVAAAQAVASERLTTATLQTTSISAIERSAANARTGLEEQAYRDNIGRVLGKAGSVLAVDPDSGQRVLTGGVQALAR